MRLLVAGAACLLLLTGCGGSLTPAQKLQDQTAGLIEQANAKDLPGFQTSLDALRVTILQQQQAGQISAGQAVALRRLLSAIESQKNLLTAPSPTPTPSATVSPTPSPTASPTRSPTPSPTPSPTASRTPPPTTAPPVTLPPTIGVGLGGPSPASS